MGVAASVGRCAGDDAAGRAPGAGGRAARDVARPPSASRAAGNAGEALVRAPFAADPRRRPGESAAPPSRLRRREAEEPPFGAGEGLGGAVARPSSRRWRSRRVASSLAPPRRARADNSAVMPRHAAPREGRGGSSPGRAAAAKRPPPRRARPRPTPSRRADVAAPRESGGERFPASPSPPRREKAGGERRTAGFARVPVARRALRPAPCPSPFRRLDGRWSPHAHHCPFFLKFFVVVFVGKKM